MNSNENVVKSYLFSHHSLISLIENSHIQWNIRDNESRHIYMNDSFKNALNIPKKFDMEGRLDKEVPVGPCQELWPEFIEYDKKVMTKNKAISSITIHYYGKGNVDNPVPFFVDKAPLYDDQKNVIGTICHGRIIDSPSLLYYMHRFDRKTIQFDAPNNLFTKRELDIIFWACQRLSSKEIARRLDLSPRTVETRLQTIYEKAGIYSRVQLIEYCKHVGLDTYIPADYVRKGMQLIE